MDTLFLFRKKPLNKIMEEVNTGRGLRRVLGPLDLVLIGIGGIIGAGIFVLTGVAAVFHSGPGTSVSFVISGLACTFAALCYAELAAMIPISGSAYTYTYATLGEFFAWIIGWDLILEYSVGSCAVAVGWSGYLRLMLENLHAPISQALLAAPPEGIINLPAIGIVIFITVLLIVGIKESARFNGLIVAIKLSVVLFVVVVGAFWVDVNNWAPFAPFGWAGIMQGAALVFFAYIGFDCVSTAAEETKNPQKNLPLGIIGSLAVCTILYVAVAAVLTGIVKYDKIDVDAPVASAFHFIGLKWASSFISVGVIAGLISVLLVLLLGQSRIFFAMSRDGLLPKIFSNVHHRFRTPYLSTAIVGVCVAIAAGFMPITAIAELTNIGTLFAFLLVCGGVIVLRRTSPHHPRTFKCPFVPFIPFLGIAFCLYLMLSLPVVTWERLFLWMALGISVYFFFSRKSSRLQKCSSKLKI